MRRTAALAALAALTLAAPAGALTRGRASSGIGDAKGDWPVASQDIVGVSASTVYYGAHPAVRAVLTLSDVPDGVAQYNVALTAGCDSWVLSARSIGGGDMQDSRMQHVRCGSGANAVTATPDTSPATVEVVGKTVVLTAPYAYGMRKGLHVTSMSAGASPFFTGVYVGHGAGEQGFVMTGDLALGDVDWTLG